MYWVYPKPGYIVILPVVGPGMVIVLEYDKIYVPVKCTPDIVATVMHVVTIQI